jgi:glycosyltransferase involved in cell wall biosynthesis
MGNEKGKDGWNTRLVLILVNIIRLAWDYPRNGQPTYGLQPVFVYLSKEQATKGNEVHVVTPGDVASNEELDNVQIHRVPTPFNINAPRIMGRLIHGKNGTVVHSHATCGLFMSIYKRMTRVPFVAHTHGTSRSHNTPLVLKGSELSIDYSVFNINYHMLRERSLWSAADRVLAVSSSSADDLATSYGIKRNKIRVVYNGVDADIFKPIENPALPKGLADLSSKRIILFVGHFGLRKGIIFLVRALDIIRREIPDAHLLCIGGTPKWLGGIDYRQILLSEVNRLGLNEHVTLSEAVKNHELPPIYNSSELLALPSYYETFSKVCLEAMSCGIPVVSTNMGGIPEVIKDGITGKLVPYGSVKGLADAIIGIMQDKNRARSMGINGRQRVLEMFTWSAVAERIQNVYNELLAYNN